MPVVAITPDTITRPEELIEYLAKLFRESELGFEYIAKYDEVLIPKYPAIHIQPANFDKTLHSTNTFLIGMRAAIHVLHANMMVDRVTRNYEDLALATKVVDFLESDMTLGEHVIHGFVESEIAGVLPPRVTKGEAIISTRLTWFGISQRRFK
jgi:hypothetical protein